MRCGARRARAAHTHRHTPAAWGKYGFFSGERQIFASQIFIHRGKFSRYFAKSGKPAPPAARHLLVRLRRGPGPGDLPPRAACAPSHPQRRGPRRARSHKRSLCACVWSTDAVRVCTRWCVRLVTGDRTEAGGECVLVYVCIRTDLILTISAHWPLSGRQIFEDFRALRAQANFDSNFGKSVFTPISG